MTRPKDAVQYDDLDDLPVAVMAKHVRGAAFQQVVRDAAMGDVRMLEALREAGRFRIDSSHVIESAIGMNSILSPAAIQVVDSLAAIILPLELKNEHDPSLRSVPAGAPKTWICELKSSAELRNVVTSVFSEILDDLSAFDGSDFNFATASQEDDAQICIRATRGVIAAVACAFDDVQLLKRCAEVDEGFALRTPLSPNPIPFSGKGISLMCAGYAVVFGSVGCIEALGAKGMDRLELAAINGNFDPDNEASMWSPLLLCTHVSPSGAPRCDVLGAILDGLQAPDGSYGADVSRWLPGQALSMMGRGNRQILDVLVKHGVDMIDQDATRRTAFECAIPELASKFLLTAPNAAFPPLEAGEEGGRWFAGNHPVTPLISNYDASNADVDSTLVMIVDSMAKRGLFGDLIEARDEKEVTFVEHLVYDERPGAMAVMLANGLDPLMRLGGRDNLSLLEFAEEAHRGNPGSFVNMMRAAVARTAALQALDAIGSEVTSVAQRGHP